MWLLFLDLIDVGIISCVMVWSGRCRFLCSVGCWCRKMCCWVVWIVIVLCWLGLLIGVVGGWCGLVIFVVFVWLWWLNRSVNVSCIELMVMSKDSWGYWVI